MAGLLGTAPAAMADPGAQSPQNQQNQQQYSSCGSVVSNPLLSTLSDSASYAPLQGGTFEDGGTGWSYNDAAVAGGNEPWNVVSATDSQSLNIGASGSATSPTFCVDNTFPSFRFFAENNGASGRLSVTAHYRTSTGISGTQSVATLSASDYSSWQLTPSIALGSRLPAGMSASVSFTFSASNDASWNIDDVLLDPYAK
jgi:hypothetical protein